MPDASPPTKPWDAARGRARADVREIFAPGEHVCASCGARSLTRARECPQCGAPYVVRKAKPLATRRARLLAGGAAVAVVAIILGLIALLSPGIERAKREDAAAAARKNAAIEASLARQLTRDQRLHNAVARNRVRAALVAELSRGIEADVRARILAGTLTGPLLRVSCEPYPPGSPPPIGRLGAYACLAVNREIINEKGIVGYEGDPFWARIEFTTGHMAWCKINPRPGEKVGGTTVTVPLAPACDLGHLAPRRLP